MTSDPGKRRGGKKLRKAVVDNLIFRTLSQLVVAVTYVVLVRKLSEHDFGLYQLFYTFPPTISAVFSLGIAVTLRRYLPEYLGAGKFSEASALLTWSMRLRFMANVLVLGIVFLFWDVLAPYVKIADYKDLFLIFSLIILAHLQCRLLTISLSSYQLQQWSMGLTAAFSCVKLLAYGGIALGDFTLQAVIIADVGACIFWYVSLAWAQRRYIPRAEQPQPFPKEERRRVLRFGVLNNFNDVGTLTLNSRTDNLFIAVLMNPLFVGAYSFCTQLEQMIQKMLPTRFFGAVVSTVVYKLNYVSEASRARQYFTLLLKLNYLTIFPVFVAIAAFPEALINVVFGGKFLEFSNVLVAVFAFSFLSTFQQPMGLIAELGERAGIILLSKISAIYNVVANIVLIPLLGIMGAVIATGTAIFFKNVFIWYFVREVATFKGTQRFFAQQFLLWGVCYLLMRYADQSLPDLLTLIAAVPIIAIASFLSLRLADFSAEDRIIFRQLGGPKLQGILRLAGVSV